MRESVSERERGGDSGCMCLYHSVYFYLSVYSTVGISAFCLISDSERDDCFQNLMDQLISAGTCSQH